MTSIATQTYADLDFATLNSEAYDQYIEYRVRGHHPQTAFIRVFDEDNRSHIICEMIEHNPYYKAQFAKRLKEIKIEELWNDKIAVHALLSAANNPFFKDSSRVAAIKELNVLIGVTVVDESGKTRAGRSLADFYG